MPASAFARPVALAVAATTLAAFALPDDASARGVCGTRDSVTKLLASRYKEAPVGIGTVSDRGVMEVYVSTDTATWSIVVTNPQGKTCIIAAGQNYEGVKMMVNGPSA